MVYPGTMGPRRERQVPETVPSVRGPNQPHASGGSAAVKTNDAEQQLQHELQLAFAPIHKRAFGVAVGATLAIVMAALTIFHLLLDPADEINIQLLSQYFYGYSLSWPGVLVGAFWGFVVGFTGGWFAAFCRNLALAMSIFITRTRAELHETRDFLDHI